MRILLTFIVASAAFAQSIPFPGPGRASVAGSPWTFSTTVTLDHTKVPATQTNFPVMFRSPVGTVTTVGTAVTYSAGDQFPTWMTTGRSIMINGVVYAISSRTTALLLVLTTSAGTQASPVAYCGTPEFATVANGGKATNANGYDVVPFTESVGVTKYDFEREKYVAATGEVIDWFRQASISSSVDTSVYYLMGNTAVTTDQSSVNATWNSAFKAVYHFGGSLSLADSTSSAITLTNNGSGVGGTGIIGNDFAPGGTSYLSAASATLDLSVFSAFTVSFWIKPNTSGWTDFDGSPFSVTSGGAGAIGLVPYINAPNTLQQVYIDGVARLTGLAAVVTSGSWHQVVIVWDGSLYSAYVDGNATPVSTFSSASAPGQSTPAGNVFVGAFASNHRMVGDIDELRVANAARSTNWLSAEFSNQGTPMTFYSMAANAAH